VAAPLVFWMVMGGLAMGAEDFSSRERLAVGPPRLSATRVPRFGRLEARLDVHGTYRTPFDPDQILVDGHFRLPSGREVVVPAFFYRPYEVKRVGEKSWLEPTGEATWLLRFAPTETGRHSLWVSARDKTGEVRSEEATFEVTPSDSRGFVRVSKADRRYLEFDDGRAYFAVGENVCTWRRGPADFDRWLPRLGEAGGNYARVWMWAQCFGVEWGKPGHYRLDHAWALDHALALAEKHGIYIKLCLEAWRGFSGPRSFVKSGVLHPYWKRNGGPCETESEFFTNPEAKRMFRNRLRYVVARWGYSTHILAWEFWNEINCVRGYRPETVVAWTAEMARHLKKIDPWGHLVVNSLGSFQVEPRLWSLPEIDFAQVHGYWHPRHPASKEVGKDMAEMVTSWLARLEPFGKPRLFAEFGLVNERWGPSPLADKDTRGVHLHNGLWASAVSGACGTAMLWWWGNYVDPHDLYHHFGAVRRFVQDVGWTTEGFRPLEVETSQPALRVIGLKGKSLTIAWLQNKEHTWWNVVNGHKVRALDATASLRGFANGRYQAEWWDTWRGRVLGKGRVEARDGVLRLRVEKLERDVALKIRPR